MSTNHPRRRDARRCPRCGAMGILPLDQPAGDHGQIQDPVMICPVCEENFRATGMKWLGAFNVANMSDEQLDAMAEHILDARAVTGALIDPFGGPDEPDPDLTPPREEDGVGD